VAKREQEPFGGAQAKPNILVIFGDDIGITNLSCYSDGLMGYETPNIDRSTSSSATSTTSTPRRSRGCRTIPRILTT
jgi:arylsulfatase A-like enzyme